VSVFYARGVAAEQAGAFLDVALTEFLSFAENAKTVANYHGGIISEGRERRKPGIEVQPFTATHQTDSTS
jgi:hypothetical protein